MELEWYWKSPRLMELCREDEVNFVHFVVFIDTTRLHRNTVTGWPHSQNGWGGDLHW